MLSTEIEDMGTDQWLDDTRHAFVDIRTAWRMFTLTASIGGLQIIWSTITSNGTPFLLSLGFSKSATAIVWSIAPICGTLIQPYFGMVSDQSKNVFGRRKPLMLGGAIAISMSLLGFASSESISNACLGLLSVQLSTHTAQFVVKFVAVLWFCSLNISIQPLQVASRAFIIESCSPDEQILAHAWASRVQGAGSILGYLLASVSLPLTLPHGGMPQFTTLCFVASILLLGTVLLSCILVPGESLHSRPAPAVQRSTFSAHVTILLQSMKRMPKPVRKICLIQCFSWMGWFPFLMYYTTYISGIHQRSISSAGVDERTKNAVLAEALRIGSLTGLYLACLACAANCALPPIIKLLAISSKPDKGLPVTRYHDSTEVSNVALVYVWTFAHAYFAIAMFLTFLVTSQTGSMMLVASVGISWAVTLWVPYSLIGVLLSKQHQGFRGEPETGAVMGLHNAAISAPQILSALISSIVFAILNGADVSVVWTLRIGGCWAVVAAVCSWKLINDWGLLQV
ncbi:sucrose transporter [Rhexocercosporidium sp. MPI-PUGE-AT-0058]|nr:sucrose transporter [Rhexocercosporidium sp. MPI-PUGE-AT-0058]